MMILNPEMEHSLSAKRYKFFTRQQGCNESLEEFVSALQYLSEDCDFGDMRESMVKDVLILGLWDRDIVWDNLLEEDPDTVDETLNFLRKFLMKNEPSENEPQTDEPRNQKDVRDDGSDEDDKPLSKLFGKLKIKKKGRPRKIVSPVVAPKIKDKPPLEVLKPAVESSTEEDDLNDLPDSNEEFVPEKPTRQCTLNEKPSPQVKAPNIEEPVDSHNESDDGGDEEEMVGQPSRQNKTSEPRKPRRRRTKYSKDSRKDCATCGKVFKCPSERARHEIFHTSEKNWQCNMCDKAYRLQAQLKRHCFEKHGGMEKYQCDLCGIETVSRNGIIRHLAGIHSLGTMLVCEQCGKKCADRHKLSIHMHKHHFGTEGFFKCSACPKSFFSKHHLNAHLDTNHPELPGDKKQCSLCGKLFNNLSLHEHNCAKRESETCQYCGKSYRNRHKFKSHLKFCEKGETERYVCEHCGHNYKDYKCFRKHEKSCIKEERICKVCGKAFIDLSSYRGHLKICRRGTGVGPMSVCVFCGVDYKKTESLDIHLRECQNRNWEKVFRCPFCSKRFLGLKTLNQHVERAKRNNGVCGIKTNRDPSRKVFECDLCRKTVSSIKSLKRHMRRHSETRCFKCDLCDKSYTQTSALKYHILRKHAFEQGVDYSFK